MLRKAVNISNGSPVFLSCHQPTNNKTLNCLSLHFFSLQRFIYFLRMISTEPHLIKRIATNHSTIHCLNNFCYRVTSPLPPLFLRCANQHFACSLKRCLHSFSNFTTANSVYLEYLSSLSAEHSMLLDSQSEGITVDQQHLAYLSNVVTAFHNLTTAKDELTELSSIALNDVDDELQEIMKEDEQKLSLQIASLEKQLVERLVSSSPSDENNIMLEVSAGVGGQEAMLFTAEVFNMYVKYAAYKGWQFDLVTYNLNGIGGVRKASALLSGKDVYRLLKMEGGVHRVQRVPRTERYGRLHTSTTTVAILPQPWQIDVVISRKDLHWDTFRSSGPGGQHVNTTDSAVRVRHLPTGTVVECQQTRSQFRNKELATKVLVSRLYEKRLAVQQAAIRSKRQIQVGTSGRSEKIRTYNYNQDRITDHRGPITVHNVPEFIDGGSRLDELIAVLLQDAVLRALHCALSDFVISRRKGK